MREIKFRAWDKEHDQMVENVSIQTGKNASNITISSEGIFVGNQCLSMILMQYTGLKDKNGQEIYEGDICIDGLGWVFTVEWDNGGSRFIGKHTKPRGDTYICYVGREPAVEVIGNIYENHELRTA